MTNSTKKIFGILLLCLTFVYSGCKKDDNTAINTGTASYDSKVAQDWYGLMLNLSKTSPGFSPPVVARAFGYTGITLYESVLPGMSNHVSLATKLNGMPTMPTTDASLEYHWPSAANAAIAEILRDLYAGTTQENKASIDSLENVYIASYSSAAGSDVVQRSREFGQSIAKAVFEYSKTDGGDECYNNNYPSDYVAPVGAGLWVPTAPNQKCLQPYWGNNRSFLAVNTVNTAPPAPLAFSTDPASPFYVQALEVYATVNNLTTAQTDVAKYWSDDAGKTSTPGGHSISILNQVLAKENSNLAFAAEAYARLGIGLNDAFISCWKAKYTYNLIRPVSYIQQNMDTSWHPILSTPPFPEYTSGHSVQSGAMARILSNLFGYDYAFTDHTHESRTDIDGSPRTYSSFDEAAQEAAISRLYGGIHYRAAIDYGVTQGRQVGNNINSMVLTK